MAAYCLFDIIEIHNEEAMNTYRNNVIDVVGKFKGKYIVIGNGTVKEGSYKPVYPVMIEFPSLDLAEAWYNSKEYSKLKELRLAAVTSNAIFFDGFVPNHETY
ncbi:DUF1330 domain-containing protein [Mariniflexile gromovii]|uniref:DUF1330 domain-containing protein n=1 Tax=Mariniflexile gromovii TaxID=362523 RepID=A0ABS4BNQ5_9FLAO|nr:DUF1330 domain-containing protein [Mariniflexile gromovii]MBP0902228.1 DUF1330 domain-containing protein [Mariniflexile gromovii]